MPVNNLATQKEVVEFIQRSIAAGNNNILDNLEKIINLENNRTLANMTTRASAFISIQRLLLPDQKTNFEALYAGSVPTHKIEALRIALLKNFTDFRSHSTLEGEKNTLREVFNKAYEALALIAAQNAEAQRVLAEQEARALAEQQARALAEQQARALAEQQAQARAEQEAKAAADARAAQIAADKAARAAHNRRR